MIDALRIIAARSPHAGAQATQCIKAIQAKSPIVNERYNRVAEMAFGDPQADFTQEERRLIAGFIGSSDDKRSGTVRFRVTEAEQASLEDKAAAANMNVSDYIRSLIWPE